MTEAELVLIVAACLCGSFVKSVTGMGFPLIAIPVLTLAIDLETAVAVVAIPNTLTNIALNIGTRHERNEPTALGPFGVATIGGAVAGTLLLVKIPETPLLLVLILVIVLYLFEATRPSPSQLSATRQRRWSGPVGSIAGVLQGVVGISGPVVAIWFRQQRLSKDGFVFAVTTVFLIGAATQLVVLAGAGAFTHDRLLAGVLGTVASAAALPVGIKVRARLDHATFSRVILVLLGGAAVSLTVRALG